MKLIINQSWYPDDNCIKQIQSVALNYIYSPPDNIDCLDYFKQLDFNKLLMIRISLSQFYETYKAVGKLDYLPDAFYDVLSAVDTIIYDRQGLI